MDTLNDKQQAWFDAYVGPARYNASEAARIAGYASPHNVTGAQVKSDLADHISAHFAANAMGKDEVAKRMADIARGIPDEFWIEDNICLGTGEDAETVRGWTLDVDGLKAAGLGHLIKGVKTTANGQNIELYPADAALDRIARFHGMYNDKVDVTSKGEAITLGSLEDLIARRRAASSTPVDTNEATE